MIAVQVPRPWSSWFQRARTRRRRAGPVGGGNHLRIVDDKRRPSGNPGRNKVINAEGSALGSSIR
jgi:hypothetical protein